MTLLGNTMLNVVGWLAEILGLALDLPDGLLVGALDERVVLEELGYGRD